MWKSIVAGCLVTLAIGSLTQYVDDLKVLSGSSLRSLVTRWKSDVGTRVDSLKYLQEQINVFEQALAKASPVILLGDAKLTREEATLRLDLLRERRAELVAQAAARDLLADLDLTDRMGDLAKQRRADVAADLPSRATDAANSAQTLALENRLKATEQSLGRLQKVLDQVGESLNTAIETKRAAHGQHETAKPSEPLRVPSEAASQPASSANSLSSTSRTHSAPVSYGPVTVSPCAPTIASQPTLRYVRCPRCGKWKWVQ